MLQIAEPVCDISIFPSPRWSRIARGYIKVFDL